MWNKIKSVLGNILPTVASVIGTPVAGIAVKGLCDILGLKGDAKPNQIYDAIQMASPETWLKLKELESQTQLKLKELDIDQIQIEQMEMESARTREIKLAESGHRDYTPSFLAIFLTLGFFSLLLLIIFKTVPTNTKDILEIMLGSLGTGFITMLTYYFGSSASSRNKDNLISRLKKNV